MPTADVATADMIVRRSFRIESRKVSYLTVEGAHAAETLLLIHGAGVSARTWVSQLRGLPRDVTPIAVDLPGHRDSDPVSEPSLEAYAEAAYQAIEHLQRGPVFLSDFVTSVTRAPHWSSTARRPFLDRLARWRPWRAWRQHFR